MLMPSITVNGQTMFYDSLGQGEPVLLMHGYMQVGRDLIRLAQALATEYQVVLPDLPGYGRSMPPFRTFPADFYQRDAALMGAFVDALKLPKVHVMGFSDGGEVALLMPILRPDLSKTVTAWGAIGHYPAEMCEDQRRNLPPRWITDEHRVKHPGQDVDRWPYQWADACCEIIAAGGDLSLSRAGEIHCPLLLMLGDHDKLNPVEDGQHFVDAVSSADKTFEVFADTGHAIQDEHPAQFLGTVRSFLKRNS